VKGNRTTVVIGRPEVERILDGWAQACGGPGSLPWVRERLAS